MKLQIFFYRENFCIVKKTRRNKKQFDFLKPTNLRKAIKRPNFFWSTNLKKDRFLKPGLRKANLATLAQAITISIFQKNADAWLVELVVSSLYLIKQ